MIQPYQIDRIFKRLTGLYQEMENDLIVQIAKYFKGDEPTDMYRWQLSRLEQMGGVRKDAIKIISEYSGKAPEEVTRAFRLVSVTALEDDEKRYQALARAGQNIPVPIGASPALEQILSATIHNAKNALNLTNTTALQASMRSYTDIVDRVYLETMTGVSSYQTAVRRGVIELADKGIQTVTYAGGRKTHVDVALRRNILTSSAQMVGGMQIQRAREWGNNLVEVSSHADARPEHAEWQGMIYSLEGGTADYPNLAAATGYGTGEGLMGWNCRHVFYPFFEGLSEQVHTSYNEEEVERAYEDSQTQRAMERDIRKWTRREMAAEALGDEDTAAGARAKIKEKHAEYQAFSKKAGRTPRTGRAIVHS